MQISKFDYLERQYAKDAFELLKLVTKQNQKENECYNDVRFNKIGEAKIEVLENMINKINEEDKKHYPKRLR